MTSTRRRNAENRAAPHLNAAFVTLAEATSRLRALRAAALSGDPYDPEEFDQAVLAERRAVRAAQVVHRMPAPPRMRARQERTAKTSRTKHQAQAA